MSHATSPRKILWAALLGWAGASGCIHNHYYTGVPGCPPGAQAVTTQVGPVCEIPSEPGTVVTSAGTNSGVVVQAPRTGVVVAAPANQPRVVISQPAAYQPTFADNIGQSVRRFEKWRRPDPEQGVAALPLRSEGGLDDGTIKK